MDTVVAAVVLVEWCLLQVDSQVVVAPVVAVVAAAVVVRKADPFVSMEGVALRPLSLILHRDYEGDSVDVDDYR